MQHRAITTLATVLGPRVSLGKSRLETLCLLVLGMVSARTVVTLAWAGRTASDLLASRQPQRKTHGYLAKSWFRVGFERIRSRLRTEAEDAIRSWLAIARPRKSRRVV